MAETLDSCFPNEKDEVLLNPLIFGDFKNALNEDEEQLYEDYESYENIQNMFENVTNVCESRTFNVNIVSH